MGDVEPEGHETFEAYKLRIAAEEDAAYAADLKECGMTAETLAAAVPLVVEGKYGGDGIDHRLAYQQVARLCASVRAIALVELKDAAEQQVLSRSEVLAKISKPPKGVPTQQAARMVLDLALQLAMAGVDHFMQTTHGLGRSGGIESVTAYFARAYLEPTSYNLSNLSQAIRLLAKGQ